MPHYKVTESGLMIPVVDSSKGEPRFKCTVITSTKDGEHTYCQKPFWDAASYEAHVAKCASEHIDQIKQAAPSTRMPAFYGPEAGIPDLERWLDKQDAAGESNRQKVIRGSKKM